MPLQYIRPPSADAVGALLERAGARSMGGGTDLLGCIESGLEPATSVVDLGCISDLAAVVDLPTGGLRIGAGARLEDIAAHPAIASRFPALALAAAAVGTPALRAMGTLGGNLAQRPRCWYLRSRFSCHKSGGAGCPAEQGENQYHAIFGDGPCRAAHPSDLAVALQALEADVVVRDATQRRRTTIDALYANAATRPDAEVELSRGEFIEAVELPAASAGGTQRFTKLMQRGAWDFATVSLAAVKRPDGTVRLVLGGVGAAPVRVNPSVEEDVASGVLDQDSVDALAQREMYDATPLAKNGYKVEQAAALLKRAMLDLSRA